MEISEKNKKFYRNSVAIILDGDAKTKVRVDAGATRALARLRETLPEVSDADLGAFASSVAFLMASLHTTQVRDIGEVIEKTYDSYTTVAAILFGAYSPDDKGFPEYVPDDDDDEHDRSDLPPYLSGQYI